MPSSEARARSPTDETWRVRALPILDRGGATASGLVVMMDLGPSVTVVNLYEAKRQGGNRVHVVA